MRRLARTVGIAHRLTPPIVHRDLKPANILVRKSSRGKLEFLVADFGIGGIAAQQALAAAREGTTARGVLLSTALRGSHTPLYASPQQIQGGRDRHPGAVVAPHAVDCDRDVHRAGRAARPSDEDARRGYSPLALATFLPR